MRDSYAALGLTPDADVAAVKSAYRELLKGCHPDLKPDDADAPRRFREITEAYNSIVEPHRANAALGQLSITGAGQRSRLRTRLAFAAAFSATTFATLMWFDGDDGSPRHPTAAPLAPSGTATGGTSGARSRAITGTDLARQRWPLGPAPTAATTEGSASPHATGLATEETSGNLVARLATTAALHLAIRPEQRSEPASTAESTSETDASQGEQVPAQHTILHMEGADEAVLMPVIEALPEHAEDDAPPDLVPVAASASSQPAADSVQSDWRYYRNPTNGFTIRYPALLQRLTAPPALPGHRLFRSADGRVVARAYSGPAGAHSIRELRRQLVAHRYQGARLDIITLARDRLVLGGTIGSEAFREIALLSCDGRAVQGLALVYPTSEAKRHEPLFEAMSRSLTTARPSAFRCRNKGATALQ